MRPTTADTLTDVQLRLLLARAIIHEDRGLARYCEISLSLRSHVSFTGTSKISRDEARAICAQAWNANDRQVAALQPLDEDVHEQTAYASRKTFGLVHSPLHSTLAGVRVGRDRVEIETVGHDRLGALRCLEAELCNAISDVRRFADLIIATEAVDAARVDTAHPFVPSRRPGFEHTCASPDCGALAHDEEHDQAALDGSGTEERS